MCAAGGPMLSCTRMEAAERAAAGEFGSALGREPGV